MIAYLHHPLPCGTVFLRPLEIIPLQPCRVASREARLEAPDCTPGTRATDANLSGVGRAFNFSDPVHAAVLAGAGE